MTFIFSMQVPQGIDTQEMGHDDGTSLSVLSNNSIPKAAFYMSQPASFTTKLAIILSLVIVGLVGFVGNSLILYFVSWKNQLNPIEKSRFMKSFNLYIRSLALSDVLSTAISLPITCIQISLEVLQNDWLCRTARYFNLVFPVITIHNLLVISVEKYFTLRRVPKTLSSSTVRKLIFLAWFLGCVITLLPAATFRRIRYDLNETHFTVNCQYDKEYLPFRVMFLSFTVIVYVLPCIFLTVINISLVRTLWLTVRIRVTMDLNNPIREKLRAAKIRGTFLLIGVTFAFIIPYFLYLGYVTFNMIAKPNIDYHIDYIIRRVSTVIAYSNTAINFAIYVVHMKDFRTFLRLARFRGTNLLNNQQTTFSGTQTESAQHSFKMVRLQARNYQG